MNKIKLARTAMLLFLAISWASCSPEPDTDADLILGRWDIQEATRNGRMTESLANLYFEFFEDGNMRTNLTGATVSATYKIDKNELIQNGDRLNVIYTIEELNDSTLLMNTDLRGYAFSFLLNKSRREE